MDVVTEDSIGQRKEPSCKLVTFSFMGPSHILPEVLDIADENFLNAWKAKEFGEALDSDKKGCLLAKSKGTVAGFLVFEIANGEIQIRYFAVGVSYQRYYIGTQLINYLKQKVQRQSLTRITIVVEETDDISIAFFTSVGFKATLKKRAFAEIGKDGYLFTFKL